MVKEGNFCTIVKKANLHEIKRFLFDRDPLGKKYRLKAINQLDFKGISDKNKQKWPFSADFFSLENRTSL